MDRLGPLSSFLPSSRSCLLQDRSDFYARSPAFPVSRFLILSASSVTFCKMARCGCGSATLEDIPTKCGGGPQYRPPNRPAAWLPPAHHSPAIGTPPAGSTSAPTQARPPRRHFQPRHHRSRSHGRRVGGGRGRTRDEQPAHNQHPCCDRPRVKGQAHAASLAGVQRQVLCAD